MPSYAYMLASKPYGTIYTGATVDLTTRIEQHKSGKGSIFTGKYDVHLLVWFGEFQALEEARDMERRIKNWRRRWKIDLIEELNPEWRDLSMELNL